MLALDEPISDADVNDLIKYLGSICFCFPRWLTTVLCVLTNVQQMNALKAARSASFANIDLRGGLDAVRGSFVWYRYFSWLSALMNSSSFS